MIFTSIEDFEVFKKAQELWNAVNAILDEPGLRKDFELRKQIADAIDSVLANLDEGFEQPTDRAFANYVYRTKGSTAEVRRRLHIAHDRGYISLEKLQATDSLCNDVRRLATGLIAHLLRSNRKDRGISGRASNPEHEPSARNNRRATRKAPATEKGPATDD